MIENSKVLVTGGAGFIGSALSRQLLENKNSVYVIDNLRWGDLDNCDNVAFLMGDVRNERVFKELEKHGIEYVFHFAAPSSVILFKEDPIECADITQKGFINAHNFAQRVGARFVYPSSGSVYSGTKTPQSEKIELSYKDMNLYAKCKLMLEELNEVGTGVRIFAGYGPGEWHKGRFASVVYDFVNKMRHDEAPVIWGDGTQKRDFVFIDDVVNAILAVAEKKTKDPVVNIGSGLQVSFNEIVNITNDILEKEIKPQYVEKPKCYLEETLCDTSLMKEFYEPQVSLEEGIRRIILES